TRRMRPSTSQPDHNRLYPKSAMENRYLYIIAQNLSVCQGDIRSVPTLAKNFFARPVISIYPVVYPPRKKADNLDQFDDRHLRCVAATRTDLDDAAVTAVSLLIFWSNLIKDLLCDGFLCNVRINLTLGMQIIFFSLGNDLFSHCLDLFCSGNCGFNLAVFQQEGNHCSKHSRSARSNSAEFSGAWHPNSLLFHGLWNVSQLFVTLVKAESEGIELCKNLFQRL